MSTTGKNGILCAVLCDYFYPLSDGRTLELMFSPFKYFWRVHTVEQQIKRCEAILLADPTDAIAHEILASLRWESHDFERAFIHGEQVSMASNAVQETLLITAASAFKIGKMTEARKYAELALAREQLNLSTQISWFMRLLSRIPGLKGKINQLNEDVVNGDAHHAELRKWAEEFVVNGSKD
jgi:hypothetical protein